MSGGEKSYSNQTESSKHDQVQSTTFTKGQKKARHVSIIAANPRAQQFYHPTPAPETVIVHSIPKKTNDACCWGCAAALCLCFGLEECCT